MHALAVGFSHKYLTENADAVRMNWPRIPLPDSKSALIRSSELGRQIAAALDANGHVEGLCAGKIRPELSVIGSISRETGGSLNPDSGDLDVTAGWGHRGNGGAVMPGKGRVIARDYMPTEREAIAAGAAALGLAEEQVVKLLGESTLDVYLNNFGYWKNIPIRVWKYTIGGYQVIKKWLSYREREILGRGLKMDEGWTRCAPLRISRGASRRFSLWNPSLTETTTPSEKLLTRGPTASTGGGEASRGR
jgi:hypothetical protein